MQIAASYSHLNGEEYLKVHKPRLLDEVHHVIKRIDAEACKTKVSKEKTMRMLYAPLDMNKAFKDGLGAGSSVKTPSG